MNHTTNCHQLLQKISLHFIWWIIANTHVVPMQNAVFKTVQLILWFFVKVCGGYNLSISTIFDKKKSHVHPQIKQMLQNWRSHFITIQDVKLFLFIPGESLPRVLSLLEETDNVAFQALRKKFQVSICTTEFVLKITLSTMKMKVIEPRLVIKFEYCDQAYRFTDISVMPIYRHFLKYRLSVSVKVRTDKISAIGYRLWPNIGSKYRLYFGDFPLIYR